MPRTPIETPDPIDVHVGARVRAERNRCGLSQGELGTAIGVTFQQIQKYERGANRISASMLLRIANTLDVAVAELFPASEASAGGRIEIGALRGGTELAERFAAMTAGQRALLLQIAREFEPAAST
jgi:transcriptional regulator with XRE-family HTH domain